MKGDHDANFKEPLPESQGKGTLFDWPKEAGMTETVLRTMERHLAQRRRRKRVAQAVVALALVFGAGLFWRDVSHHDRVAVASSASPFVTAPVRRVLADGSTAELREGAEISVEYGSGVRRVKILRGEVYFDVAKDTAREFVVQAAGVEVRAVGTEFAVEVGQASVDVLVTEGRVAVRSAAGPAGRDRAASLPAVILDAGHHLSTPLFDVQNMGSAERLSPGKIDERLTWRIPWLQFAGTPLRDAVEVINRHSRVHLELAEADLGTVRLSGSIRADNVEALLALLEVDYGVEAERIGEAHINLRRRR